MKRLLLPESLRDKYFPQNIDPKIPHVHYMKCKWSLNVVNFGIHSMYCNWKNKPEAKVFFCKKYFKEFRYLKELFEGQIFFAV